MFIARFNAPGPKHRAELIPINALSSYSISMWSSLARRHMRRSVPASGKEEER